MYRIRVKYRGRDIAVHTTESESEARDLAHVYFLLGYPEDKVVFEEFEPAEKLAA